MLAMSLRRPQLQRESRAIRYQGRQPASEESSAAARGASKKSDTRCEVALRQLLWRAGCRFRKNDSSLPGKPDVVFPRVRIVLFCDGDFWHGRDWEQRKQKLGRGTNSDYWVAKIGRNREQDSRHTRELLAAGWTVLRVWETDVMNRPASIVAPILALLDERGHRRPPATSRPR